MARTVRHLDPLKRSPASRFHPKPAGFRRVGYSGRALAPQERFARYLVGRERCIWCSQPIPYQEMEVEHLIPKDLEGDELPRVLALHGLPPDYDLEALENLAPSCRNCNSRRSTCPPPDTPIIAILLDAGVTRARAVRDRAKVFIERRDVS